MGWEIAYADGRTLALSPGITDVGRDPSNTIVLDDDSVSRRHARLHVEDGAVRIEDPGSTNGTYVDGRRIENHVLTGGEEVRFGDNIVVRVLASEASAAVEEPLGSLEGMGQKIPLFPGVWQIGRDESADIVLGHTDASRRHAELRVTPETVFVRDLGSTNGTFVDDRKISETQLSGGERIGFGPCLFVFNKSGGQRVAAPVAQTAREPAPPPNKLPPQRPAAMAPPLPPAANSGGGTAWIGVVIVLALLVGGGWWAKEAGVLEASAISAQLERFHRDRRPDPEAEAARKRREAALLRKKAQALAADRDFLERLHLFQAAGDKVAEFMVVAGRGMASAVQAADRIEDSKWGSEALRRAHLEDVPRNIRSLCQGLERLKNDLEHMVRTARALRGQLHAFGDNAGEQELLTLGPTARDAARQAGALSDLVSTYRGQLEQSIQMVIRMEEIAAKLRMSSVGSLLQDFAEPAAAVAGQLRSLEQQINRDLENFQLLEKAASAARTV